MKKIVLTLTALIASIAFISCGGSKSVESNDLVMGTCTDSTEIVMDSVAVLPDSLENDTTIKVLEVIE